MTTKVIDISEYGKQYTGKPVSMKEPTCGDMLAVTEYMMKDKKANGGEANMLKASMFLLTKIIIDAPFASDMRTLQELPFKLINYLANEAGELISPLQKKDEQI